MPAKLSTHVLDTANGCPASGMKIELWSLDGEQRRRVTTTLTNANGRTEAPLLSDTQMRAGQYELLFFVGDYYAARSADLPAVRFLDTVPVRFGLADAGASYHVPRLCTPGAYSTYRGS
jgi:5-hydroxyisourate hydrolase